MFGDYERALAEQVAALVADVIGTEVFAVAGGLPAELPSGDDARIVQVVGVAGQVVNPGMWMPGVIIHSRATSDDMARQLAGYVDSAAERLDREQVSKYGATIVAIMPESVPYVNPDPGNLNFFRYSQQYTLTVTQ